MTFYFTHPIDVAIYLAESRRFFRGHSESKSSNKKGLYLEIFQLLAKYDSLLKDHIENGPKNATYLSNFTQNDIIISMENVIMRSLI